MQFSGSKDFYKSYRKLPQRIKEQFKLRRDLFVQNEFHPQLNNHGLLGKYVGHRSINITGDYRAIYEKRGQDVVYWVSVGTHAQLYE
jgi:addiction module RelE/StbE family toxin